MKLFAALLLASGSIYAQCSGIQITDTLYTLGASTPTLMDGTIDLTIYNTIPGPSGRPVVRSTARVTVTNGALSYCAPPLANITATYTVTRPLPLHGKDTYTRYWGIPSTGGPYKLLDDGIEQQAAVPTPIALGNYCLEKVNGVVSFIQHSCGTGILWDAIPGLIDAFGLIDNQ
jgi:hypothetical protein